MGRSKRRRVPNTRWADGQWELAKNLQNVIPQGLSQSHKTVNEPTTPESNEAPQELSNGAPIAQCSPSSAVSNGSSSSAVERFSTRNRRTIFGFFRTYFTTKAPIHDPEEFITLKDLCEGPGLTGQALKDNVYHPYPNKTTFCLADWYWNYGARKSKDSFKALIKIVGSTEFRPEDVRNTRWDHIDSLLGENDFDDSCLGDGGDEGGEWVDRDKGWIKTPIHISVPFHSRAKYPGPKNFLAGDLYHRSLVDVIREKIQNPADSVHFHYDPFELFWAANKDADGIRVHGEVYTSPAFIEAHQEVQALPGEPNCTLPKVVVALMFASDSTHLTSFGNAKLWPCYLYFGNESKYRRCKPSCNCCSHVAYFQAVSMLSSTISFTI